uniref:Adenosine receptor A2b-like n=1 Tax=Petromyzon marinus TaxID=7757 RepID=A0AAJ7TTS1_PETMA|nr:adenosine receptor A2b-like [Petromyzon marinus]
MLALPHDETAAETFHVVYIALELVLALLAIGGNVLVCWAVRLNRALRNPTNYFLLSLAAADIAVGLLAIPFAVTISAGFACHFHGCLFLACFVLVLTQSSIFSLLAIAIDRYIAIRQPLRYNALVTSKRARGVIAVCWLLSFVIGLTPLLGWNNWDELHECGSDGRTPDATKCRNGTQVQCLFENVVNTDYMVYFNFFGCVLVPLLVMLAVYARIFLVARTQLQLIEKAGSKAPGGDRRRNLLQREVHAAKSLAFIMGMFALCWLPLHALNCVHRFCPDCVRPPWAMYGAILLSHGNSVVNPVIYAFRLREFRATFRRILSRWVLPPALPCGRRRRRGSRARRRPHRSDYGDGGGATPASRRRGSALDSAGTSPCTSVVSCSASYVKNGGAGTPAARASASAVTLAPDGAIGGADGVADGADDAVVVSVCSDEQEACTVTVSGRPRDGGSLSPPGRSRGGGAGAAASLATPRQNGFVEEGERGTQLPNS